MIAPILSDYVYGGNTELHVGKNEPIWIARVERVLASRQWGLVEQCLITEENIYNKLSAVRVWMVNLADWTMVNAKFGR